MLVPKGQEKEEMGSWFLMGRELGRQKKFWKWMMATVSQQYKCKCN